MQQEVLRIFRSSRFPSRCPGLPRGPSAAGASPRRIAPTRPCVARIAQAVPGPATATVTYEPLGVPDLRWNPRTRHLEEPHAPPTRAPRAPLPRRPPLMLGVAAALVIGAHFALTATPSASAEIRAAAEPADARDRARRVAAESAGDAELRRTAHRPAAAETHRARDPRTRTRAMTPGPAFAGSVPAAPGADSGPPPKAAAHAPDRRPRPEEAASAIAPGAGRARPRRSPTPPTPTRVAPKRTGDSMAMKKILRAINGGKRCGGFPER